ncbi:D-alanine--D-alanine ligase [Haloferula sp. BvORR071]|uniref:D-alanine--D-alanine ligase n=1 Tax=Haloferula sp. BvORR071 TaxID=1396141 RepID=UPI000552C4B3|nr:D-alanine--D-alanine ligase [Haloferula sp. BvORR071]
MIDSSLLIAVLMGGPGSEREVSLASGKAVLKALQAAGCNAVGVDVTSKELSLPEGTGLAYNVIHGTFGEDGQLQSILEGMEIPYTGAGVASSRLAFDKNLAKDRFVAADVPTPHSEIVDVSNGVKLPSIPVPFVVKPPREGSSVGVTVVKDPAKAMEAMETAAKYGNEILVESFVEGKELTVGILDNVAMPIVHIAPRDGFYDMSNKYPWLTGGAGSDYYCPADLDAATTRRVQEAALAGHKSLGVEVYSRVDVLLDAAGNPFVLEANTIPGMTETSLLPKSAAAHGIDFTTLCLKIAELSLAIRSY